MWRREKMRTVVTAAETKSAGAAFFSKECSSCTQVLCFFPDCYTGSSQRRWQSISHAPENTKTVSQTCQMYILEALIFTNSKILHIDLKKETEIHPSLFLLFRWIQVVSEEAALDSLPSHRQRAPPVGQRLGPPSPLQAPPDLPGDPATEDSAHRPQAVRPQHPLSPQPKPSDAQGEVGGSVTSVGRNSRALQNQTWKWILVQANALSDDLEGLILIAAPWSMCSESSIIDPYLWLCCFCPSSQLKASEHSRLF